MRTVIDYSVVGGLARSFAAKLIGSYGFGCDDFDDLVQEFLLEYQRRLPKYDPKRASQKTFARLVMKNHLLSLIESQCAQRRDYRRHEQLGDEEDVASRANSRHVRGSDDLINLRMDVARAVGTLRSDLAHLANLLQVFTITEIARSSSKSRGAIYRKRAELRQLFEAAGLRPSGTPSQSSQDNISHSLGGKYARRKQ
jgi:RNA polymerase sigma factor (sigma-70 family)